MLLQNIPINKANCGLYYHTMWDYYLIKKDLSFKINLAYTLNGGFFVYFKQKLFGSKSN